MLFRSHSWLSYGAEKIQERLWNAIGSSIQKGESKLQRHTEVDACSASASAGGVCAADQDSRDLDRPVYLNPCMLVGHREIIGASTFSLYLIIDI